MNTEKLSDVIIDSLVKSGYGPGYSVECAARFMQEIKAYPAGKHTIYAGEFKITFLKH